MNWKVTIGVLGGGVLGVGAVALAPFTGGGSIAGAIALGEALTVGGAVAGVVGGGVVGAGAGYASSKNDENKINNAKEKGKEEAKAEYDIKFSKLNKKLKESYNRMTSANKYFETLIAMENVAVAVISYNGINTRTKQNEISELLRSLSNDTLPKKIKNKINNIYLKPPTIQEALLLAKNANLDRETCKDTIILSSEICNIENNKFLIEWEKKYNRSKV